MIKQMICQSLGSILPQSHWRTSQLDHNVRRTQQCGDMSRPWRREPRIFQCLEPTTTMGCRQEVFDCWQSTVGWQLVWMQWVLWALMQCILLSFSKFNYYIYKITHISLIQYQGVLGFWGFGVGYLDTRTGNTHIQPIAIMPDYSCVVNGKLYR